MSPSMRTTAVIAVIGGGSVNWMRGLMKDIYLIEALDGGEIRLVDPNAEHVDVVAAMLRTFNEMRGKRYAIRVTADRRAALEGADFVITTFSPGAMDAFWNDLELPVKYGIQLPVSMTVGACGISASLRTAPVAYEIVREMEELCPGAMLLNVTNPMSVVTGAMNAAAKTVKVIGFCHESHCLPAYMGPMLGLGKPDGMSTLDYMYRWLPEQGFAYTIAGLNHFVWLTKAELVGKDMLPQIRAHCLSHERLEDSSQEGGQATSTFRSTGMAKFALCRQFGYLPLVGDRHLVEFYPSLCNVRNGFGTKYGVRKTTVDGRRLMKRQQFDHIRDIAAGRAEIDWTASGEELSAVVAAVCAGRSVRAIVNAPNRGQIANLPLQTIVETMADVSRDGIVPLDAGELPSAIGSLARLHADVHDLTLRAALEGSRELLVQALSLDPAGGTADFGELPQLADELLNANREWLPRFYA